MHCWLTYIRICDTLTNHTQNHHSLHKLLLHPSYTHPTLNLSRPPHTHVTVSVNWAVSCGLAVPWATPVPCRLCCTADALMSHACDSIPWYQTHHSTYGHQWAVTHTCHMYTHLTGRGICSDKRRERSKHRQLCRSRSPWVIKGKPLLAVSLDMSQLQGTL